MLINWAHSLASSRQSAQRSTPTHIAIALRLLAAIMLAMAPSIAGATSTSAAPSPPVLAPVMASPPSAPPPSEPVVHTTGPVSSSTGPSAASSTVGYTSLPALNGYDPPLHQYSPTGQSFVQHDPLIYRSFGAPGGKRISNERIETTPSDRFLCC